MNIYINTLKYFIYIYINIYNQKEMKRRIETGAVVLTPRDTDEN